MDLRSLRFLLNPKRAVRFAFCTSEGSWILGVNFDSCFDCSVLETGGVDEDNSEVARLTTGGALYERSYGGIVSVSVVSSDNCEFGSPYGVLSSIV